MTAKSGAGSAPINSDPAINARAFDGSTTTTGCVRTGSVGPGVFVATGAETAALGDTGGAVRGVGCPPAPNFRPTVLAARGFGAAGSGVAGAGGET